MGGGHQCDVFEGNLIGTTFRAEDVSIVDSLPRSERIIVILHWPCP